MTSLYPNLTQPITSESATPLADCGTYCDTYCMAIAYEGGAGGTVPCPGTCTAQCLSNCDYTCVAGCMDVCSKNCTDFCNQYMVIVL